LDYSTPLAHFGYSHEKGVREGTCREKRQREYESHEKRSQYHHGVIG
jgi:hypothetical protein